MVAMVTTAMAQSSLLVNDALGTFTNGQYSWKSGEMTKAEGATKLRVTFLETSNNEKPAGFPCVAIAEFYLYDKDGKVVTLKEENFSSNATHVGEGSVKELCDGATTKQEGEGDNDWYWHSQWSGTPNPYGYHYLEIDLTNVTADLSEYSIGWVTRRSQASPKKIVVSTGATTNEAAENANNAMMPKVSTDLVCFYTIRSVRSKKYLTYSEENAKPVQNNAVSNESYWYFTEGTEGKVVMHNAVSGKVIGTNFEMSTEGEWKLLPAKYRPGIVISNTGDYINSACIDDQNGSIGGWSHNSGDNEGTTWLIEEVKNAPVNVAMLSLQGKSIASIGSPVTEVVVDKWYILNNVGRGNYVSQEGDSWKMRPAIAEGQIAEARAGYLFKITKNGEYYNIISGNGKYFQLGQNTASTSATAVNFEIGKIGESTDIFYLFDKDHGYAADGQETGYAFVGWATTPPASAGGNDSYKLLPVTLEEVSYTVVYNFVYDNEVKFSQTVEKIKPGNEYPDMTIKLPYGVVSDFVKPSGNVEGNSTHDFELNIESALPFGVVANGTPTKWYYVRMHTNQPGYIGDVADNNTVNVAWGKASDSYNENFVWGFVGDVFSGVKMVNKAGLQLTSTGSGDVTLSDNGTAFFVARTSETSENAKNGFCLRRFDSNNYLNANYGAAKLSHWSSADAGSTFFLTEYEETNVAVSDVNWATMYLGYQAYIPEGVNVYAITGVEKGWVTKSQLEGVIPANTGVLLENAGNFTFKRAAKDVAALKDNLMNGSVENKYIEGTAYVLANHKESGIGMYKAVLNFDAEGNKVAEGETGTHFLNNAGKAYLVLPTLSETVAFYGLDWDGTTGIDEVKGENEVKAIFDLTGRRVEAITAPGIYIVNGKKVLVK